MIHLIPEYLWKGGISVPLSFPKEPIGYSTSMWVTFLRAHLPPQFPLDNLHLWKLPPYSKTEAHLPHEEGEMEYRTYPFSQEVLWKCSEESHCLSNPVALTMPSSTLPSLLKEGMQLDVELGYNWAFQLLQSFNKAQAQLKSKQSEEA